MAKILVVDDDAYIRDLYQKTFKFQPNYEIETASDGQEALDKLTTFKPDLLLLDIAMPRKNGLEVIAEMKVKPETKDIPIVMLTNITEDEHIKKSFHMGAVGYLLKSELSPEEVREEVKKFLTPGRL